MKKVTTLNYNLESGKKVIITVERTYGTEKVHHNVDGFEYEKDEFQDSCFITFDVPDFKIHTHQMSKRIDTKGTDRVFHAELPNGRRAAIAMPQEIAEKIEALASESLTDEVTSEYEDDEYYTDENKAAAYDKAFNDGGYGYNPYRDIKKTYDIEFNDDNDTNSKGFELSRKECEDWIRSNRDDEYFHMYAGGTVSVRCNQSGDVVFEENI